MSWFHSRINTTKQTTTGAGIEVIAHKNSNKKEVQKANQANAVLKDVLDKNGFTIKIFLAAGGQTKKAEHLE